MRSVKLYPFLLLIGFIVCVLTPVDAQFVAIARKVKSMRAGDMEVATVLLDAKTYKVYRAVIDTLNTDPKFTITRQDNTKRFVEFTKAKNSISIQVDSLADGLSQITVAAKESGSSSQ